MEWLMEVSRQMNEPGEGRRAVCRCGPPVGERFFGLGDALQDVVAARWGGFAAETGRAQRVIEVMPAGVIVRATLSADFIRPRGAPQDQIKR